MSWRGVLAVALLVVAGCQDVLGLRPVSAEGHDEDGDGVVDALDPCPGIASSDPTDTDGDGIGDSCDPQPGKRDMLLKFYPFDSADELAQFTPLGGHWTVQDEALFNDEHTSNQEDHILEARPRDLPIAIEAGVTVDTIDPTPGGGAFLIGIEYVDDQDVNEYSCNIRRTLDTNDNVIDQVENFTPAKTLPRPLANSKLRPGAEYRIREILTGTSLTCEVIGAAGDGGTASQPVSAPDMPESVGVYTQDTTVHYRYIAIYALGS